MTWFSSAQCFAGEHDSGFCRKTSSKVDAGELHDWIGRKCVLTQRSTTAREHRTWRFCLTFGSQPLTSNCNPFFSKEGPIGEPCTLLRSSYRCDSDDWPVIFGNSETGKPPVLGEKIPISPFDPAGGFECYLITRTELPVNGLPRPCEAHE